MNSQCSCGGTLIIKDHGTWEGFYCPKCKGGGSSNKKSAARTQSWNRRLIRKKQEFQLSQVPVCDISPAFSYHKEDRLFTVEISSVKDLTPTEVLMLRNPKTNNRVQFHLIKIDKDVSGEDLYGWKYESQDEESKKLKLLIIND